MSDLRMPDLNKVIVAGRLTRDPELRYLPSGQPFCRVSLANSRRFRKKDSSEWQEETTFLECSVWGPHAEYVGQKMGKGRPVIVEGRLRTSEWEDKQTGQKRSRTEILAERVTLLDWDDSQRGGAQGGGGYAQGGQGGGGYGGGQQQRPPAQAAPQSRDYDYGDMGPEPEDDIPF
jgi:single-strand DNA-binding protein